MDATIAPLGSGDVRAAGNVLSAAFKDDPVIGKFLHGRLRRRLAYPAFFRTAVRELHSTGHVDAAYHDGRLIGVAAWLTPVPRSLDRTTRLRNLADQALLRALFPRGMRALDDGFAGLASKHPSEPHWYLAFVGIDPGHQSLGLGSAILSPVLTLADATGLSCYLETPFTRTFAFYERLGFQHREETRTFRGAPPVWTLLRPPNP